MTQSYRQSLSSSNTVAFPRLSAQLLQWTRVLTFLFILALALWPGYAELRPFGLPNIAPTRMLSLLLFGIVLITFFLSAEAQALFLKRLRENGKLLVLLVALYAFKGISALKSAHVGLAVVELIKLDVLLVFPVFFYALFALRGREDLRRIMLLLMLAGFLISIMALGEWVLKRNLVLSYLPISTPDSQMLSGSTGGFRDNVYRVQGPFAHPLALSEFLSAVLPIGIYLLLLSKNHWTRLLYGFSMVLMCAAIYLTRSRAGMGAVAFAVGLLFLVLILRWLRGSKNYVAQYLILLQIPALLCAMALTAYGYRDYFAGHSMEEQRSTSLRGQMLSKGLPLVAQNPIFGMGAGKGSDAVGIKTGRFTTTIDNYYLLLALDSGLPSTLLFIAVLWLMLATLWRLGKGRDRERSLMAAVLAVSILIFALHATIQALTSVFPILFVLFAMTLVLKEDAAAAPATAPRGPLNV